MGIFGKSRSEIRAAIDQLMQEAACLKELHVTARENDVVQQVRTLYASGHTATAQKLESEFGRIKARCMTMRSAFPMPTWLDSSGTHESVYKKWFSFVHEELEPFDEAIARLTGPGAEIARRAQLQSARLAAECARDCMRQTLENGLDAITATDPYLAQRGMNALARFDLLASKHEPSLFEEIDAAIAEWRRYVVDFGDTAHKLDVLTETNQNS